MIEEHMPHDEDTQIVVDDSQVPETSLDGITETGAVGDVIVACDDGVAGDARTMHTGDAEETPTSHAANDLQGLRDDPESCASLFATG